MVEVTRQRFEELVGDALDAVPEELARLMDNVFVVVEDDSGDPDLLGHYDGVPLTERHDYGAMVMPEHGGMVMPDRIVIFRGPICEAAADEEELVGLVSTTVIHEVAHHFGISDARLEELGWA